MQSFQQIYLAIVIDLQCYKKYSYLAEFLLQLFVVSLFSNQKLYVFAFLVPFQPVKIAN